MIVLNKYRWDKFAYLINNKYILFIPKVIVDLEWKIKQTFNFSDPIERQLSRINGFYEVLSKVNVWRDKLTVIKLEELVRKDPENALIWESDAYQDMWDFYIWYDYEGKCRRVKWCERWFIIAWYSEYWYGEHIQWLERWDEYDRYECYTLEEFNLLMQIYYGVYDDEILRRELEEKERRWEYERYKRILEKKDIWEIIEHIRKMDKEKKEKWEEYLKLKLMGKDTHWAFPELIIKKIYDKDWLEKEQKKVIEWINKELGREVVVLE